MKTCSKCGIEKSLDQYSKNRARKDGLHEACKPCDVSAQRARRDRRCPLEKAATERANHLAGRLAKESAALVRCLKCGEQKAATEFYFNKTVRRGLCNHCKACAARDQKGWRQENAVGTKNRPRRRRAYLRDAYHMTEGEFLEILQAQGGFCGICKEELLSGPATHIDHDHATGAVRGLLCRLCNTALGKFKDSPELLRRAAEYLEKHEQLNKTNTTS